MPAEAHILVVDDQESARLFLGRFLEECGYRVSLAATAGEARDVAEREALDVVLTDLRMPGQDGIELLRQLRGRDPQLAVIVLTAYATVETAVHAMKLGAFDYLRKPFEPEELALIVARALEHRHLLQENRRLRREVGERYRLENLIGKSPAMGQLFARIRRVAPVDVPVLISGESGTGKDLVARAIHGLSSRAAATFLSINCAAVHETLLESELFGHERGAFSGAERARLGYFREAHGGTLFLDEIGDMSLGQQAKLLRVIESGELIPVGSEQPVRVDIRLIAATHQPLEELSRAGTFRADLLYRIDTMPIRLPPLRERTADIPLLVAHFIERAPMPAGSAAPRMGAAAMRMLLDYAWPGNVRELEHAVEHAALVAAGAEIGAEDLPPRIREAARGGGAAPQTGDYRAAKVAFERDYFRALLARADGNVTRAAQLSGLHRATLHEKLRRLGL